MHIRPFQKVSEVKFSLCISGAYNSLLPSSEKTRSLIFAMPSVPQVPVD